MAATTVVKVRRDGTITFADNAGFGGANTYTVAYENGDLSFNREKSDRVVIRDRGAIAGLRKADDPVNQISFSVHMRDFTDGTSDALVDVLDFAGAASGWTTTGGTGYEEKLLDIKITVEGSNHGDSADHTATFTKVLFIWDFAEGDPNVVNVSGEIYGGAPTLTGQA